MRPLLVLISLLSLLSSGCLTRTRKITPPPASLLDASLEDLLGELRRLASIQSMKATVDLQLTYQSEDRTKETELRDVRGFILARRPEYIRVQAQTPVTGSRAFDMASNGSIFRVYLSWKQRFFQGKTDVQKRSEKRAENIRPQHVLEAVLIEPPAEDETPALDRVTEGFRHFYVVHFLTDRAGAGLQIRRKIWFDRTTLRIARIEIRDDAGEAVARMRYRGWTDQFSLVYPMEVIMSRPLEGYDLAIRFLDPGLNEDVPDESFVLDPPKGVDVEIVGEDDINAETANSR